MVAVHESSTRGQTRVFRMISNLHKNNYNKINILGIFVTIYNIFTVNNWICIWWSALLVISFTSPRRRLASPGAALLKPGGKPMLEDNKLCISARLDPPCPLACRWRTVIASSRWSSSLLAYRKNIIRNNIKRKKEWKPVNNNPLHAFRQDIN